MFSSGRFVVRRQLFTISVAALLLIGACAKSNPVAPSSTPASAQAVTVTASPLPLPSELRGSSLRASHLINGALVFRETAGLGARLTEMTLLTVNAQGQGVPSKIPLNLTLAPGATATQPLSALLDTSTLHAPFQLQVTVRGTDTTGRAFTGPSVQLPVSAEGGTGTRSAPIRHVFVLVEENAGMEESTSGGSMPYLQSLANQYATTTQYFANTHPSIGNYFMMTTGGIVRNDSNFGGIVSDDNIVRQLLAVGKTWKSYAEDLPSVGYTGEDTGLYAKRHNPFAYFSDVVNDPAQAANIVPFTQFASDLATYSFPDYSFIVPNLCNDGHDCPLRNADAWLRANIAPLIANTQFQKDGLLIILFDEATDADKRHGGGRVGWVAVSGRSKRGYRSSTFYQHESTLRLTLEVLGVHFFPGRGASAPDMSEFFTP